MHLPLTDKKFLHATAVLIGTMVGVGIFGIPFSFAKAGFWIGFGFLLLTGAMTVIFNLLFAEVVLRTEGKHQLVGYTDIYLGPFFKRVVLLTNLVGIYGALLAYIIIAGEFLKNIFSQFFYLSPLSYNVIFFFAASVLLPFGFRTIAWVEFFLTALFIGVVFIIFGAGAPQIQLANLATGESFFWFLPYGVLLFAFAGLTSIPIQREVLRGQEHQFKKSILLAVTLVGALYLLFAFTVVGVSGEVTTPDALSGLFEFLGEKVILLGSLFGVLAITTSYLMLGTALRDIFRLDYSIRRIPAVLLVVLPPFILFLGGLRMFIDVISLVGSVAIGLESIVLLFVFRKAKRDGSRVPEYTLHLPSWLVYLLILLFSLGIIYAIFTRS